MNFYGINCLSIDKWLFITSGLVPVQSCPVQINAVQCGAVPVLYRFFSSHGGQLRCVGQAGHCGQGGQGGQGGHQAKQQGGHHAKYTNTICTSDQCRCCTR
jgi:hypothetical protein